MRDATATEDPLEIRLDGSPLAVTMRTPGDDADLVRGFLLTEGIAVGPDDIAEIEHFDDSRVSVRFVDGIEIDASRFQRNMFVSSSCGVCGKASIEAVRLMASPAGEFTVARSVVAGLTGRLRERQPTFDETGGLHAAGVFRLDGEPLAVREDVGRHNAVDKAIGVLAEIHVFSAPYLRRPGRPAPHGPGRAKPPKTIGSLALIWAKSGTAQGGGRGEAWHPTH